MRSVAIPVFVENHTLCMQEISHYDLAILVIQALTIHHVP